MQTDSFLSHSVRYLICHIHEDGDFQGSARITHLEDDEWHDASRKLSQNHLLTPNDFIEAVESLLPMAKSAHQKLISEKLFWTEQSALYIWLSKYDNFPKNMTVLANGAEKMLNLLKFVSTFERALGDVCVELGESCPFLLKDLLLLEKLKRFFGIEIMKALQVLIGNPHGINLRNLAWHGFLQPHEIPDIYMSLLIFIVKKMAGKLDNLVICRRPVIRNSSVLKFLNEVLADCCVFPMTTGLITPCCGFPMVEFMREGLRLHNDERYGDCVILLLPCLEAYMRVVYATANNCKRRVLTAESSQFYTTMDEILSLCGDDIKENRFSCISGDGVMTILIDLFQLQDGPRLRDKLSHGEMALEALSYPLAMFVCLLTLKMYVLAHSATTWCSCNSRETATRNKESHIDTENCMGVVAKFDQLATNYHSLFHPLCIASRSYSSTKSNVILFGELPYPSDFKPAELNTVNTASKEIPSIPSWKTLFRNGGCEVTNILRRITKESQTSSSNVVSYCRQRWQMHNQRILRSRQRTNYRKLIERLNEIRDLFVRILQKAFRYLQLVGEMKLHEVDRPTTLKDLRRLLKTVENLRTLTAENKWDDVCTLTRLF